MKKITFTALAVPLMWVLLLLLFSNYKVYAQEHTVLSGVVKTADGTPMEGVTVWQQNTDNGTQTNEQGFYTLSISPNAVIVFEYIGYKTQTVKASGSILNVTLVSDEDLLDEVVINAGYYSVKDKERTGSISKITSKEISQQPVANPLAAMQGRMAGVNITQSSGTPGGGFDIQIRGRNSLRTEGNAPLYIVDGVPFLTESNSFTGISATILNNTANNPLEMISPNDIESIEVLKDADATAIYGSRGANGVVLITTKKGNNNSTVFTLQSHTAVGVVPTFMKKLNNAEYLELRRQAFVNDGISEYPANAYDVNGTWEPDRYTNWQKVLIGGKAVSRHIAAGMHGGDKQNRYRIQVGTSSDGTVFPGAYGMSRKNMSAQFEHKTANDQWRANVQLARAENINKLLGSDLTGDALKLAPNAPALYDGTGNLNWENGTWDNPLRYTAETYENSNAQWLAVLDVEGQVHKNIKIRIQGGINESSGNEMRLTPHTFYNPAFDLTSSISTNMLNNHSSFNWNIEPQVNYLKIFEKHKIEATVGSTFLKQEYVQQIWLASDFSSNSQLENLQAAKDVMMIGNYGSLYAYHAIFARFNYHFQNRFIVNLTGRRDGSSRFGPERQWGNFGALGAAWLFWNEKFLEGSTWISFGKLRASYGIAGNDRIGDYQYLDTYGNSGGSYDIGGISPIRAFNPEFGWETGLKKEIALEMAFFNNSLSFSVAYYHNLSSNQLVGIPLPGTTGFVDIQANMPATVRNTGLEIELKSHPVRGVDYSWDVAGTLSINRNTLLQYPGLEHSAYKNVYEIGHPTSLVKVYEFTGIDPETGFYSFKDFNGDGKLTAVDDAKLIVDLTPSFFGALQQNFAYKKWSLGILLYGVKQKGTNYLFTSGMPGTQSNQPVDFANDKIQNPSAGYNPQALNAYNMYTKSQAAYTDASYLRLKNVSIAYGLTGLFNTKASGQLYLMAQNLLTWTAYKGLDPESQSAVSVPPLRVIGLGVSVNY